MVEVHGTAQFEYSLLVVWLDTAPMQCIGKQRLVPGGDEKGEE